MHTNTINNFLKICPPASAILKALRAGRFGLLREARNAKNKYNPNQEPKPSNDKKLAIEIFALI